MTGNTWSTTRLAAGSTIATVLAAVAVLVAASSAAASTRFAQGSGFIVAPDRQAQVQWVAHDTGVGTEAWGHWRFERLVTEPGVSAGDVITGEVTCLNIFGNTASLGVRITSSDEPTFFPVGSGFHWFAQDDGNGTMPNLVARDAVTPTAPTTCNTFLQPTAPFDGPVNVRE